MAAVVEIWHESLISSFSKGQPHSALFMGNGDVSFFANARIYIGIGTGPTDDGLMPDRYANIPREIIN